jgi:hypothetical protein
MEILRDILLQQQSDSARMPAVSDQTGRRAQDRKRKSKPTHIEDTQGSVASAIHHVLLRQTFYAERSLPRRMELRRRVAVALEAAFGARFAGPSGI